MNVIHGLESVRFSGVVLTIGNFDGVHRGHRAILAAGRQQAEAAGTQLVAMTFDPHPSAVLTPDRIPEALTPAAAKIHHLQAAGVDVVIMIDPRCTFLDTSFLSIPAGDFVQEIILERFRPAAMVEGASFGFGHHRQGDVNTLREAARRHGFHMEVVEPVRVELGGHPGTVISSSLIRHLLKSGTADHAALCLGRPYTLLGQVVHGVGRGRTLGLATANLAVEGQLVPAEGVYAGQVEVDHRLWAAAVSIGRKATFSERDLTVEAHLLDFAGDLYGRHLGLELHEWLRPQQRFDSPQSLCEQMARDVARTRELFETIALPSP